MRVPRRRRVLLVCPSLAVGGAERAFVWLANSLANAGHSVELFAASDGPLRSALALKIPYHCPSAARMLGAIPDLAKRIRLQNPDIIFACMEHATAACVIARRFHPAALVGTVHTVHRLRSSRVDSAFIRRLAYSVADLTLAVSRRIAADLSSNGVRSVRYVPNAVDVDSLKRAAKQPSGHPWLDVPDVPVVVSVGRVESVKDHETFLRAVRIVRDSRPVRAVLVGAGSKLEAINQLASDLGLTDAVALVGHQQNPASFVSRAAAFVMTSRIEGFGLALAEALALGIPCISTDAPYGPREILGDSARGFLVPVGDEAAVARAICEALAGRAPEPQLPQEYMASTVIEQYEQIIETLTRRFHQ